MPNPNASDAAKKEGWIDGESSLQPPATKGSTRRDLVGRGRRGHGFMIEHNKLVENDGELDKLKVKIHCGTTLVPGGRIDLEVSGESRRGFDADCTAIIAVVEALRMQYGIFPADYSYAVIAEKRGIFNEMGAALEGFINAYFEMDDSIAGYHSSIINLTGELSNWLTNSHTAARVYTKAAVRAMNVWATKCASAIMKERTVTTNVVSMLSAKEPPPASLVRMDRTAPMPMKLDWEASYQVMRLEFDTAIAKLGMEVSNIDVSGLTNGKYTATVAVSCEPHKFTAEAEHSPVAAKAKLMFTALGCINNVLGYSIIDFNHEVKNYIDNHIRQFDNQMDLVWQCGGRLVHLSTSCITQFTRMVVDIESKISADPGAHLVLSAMEESEMRVAECKEKFGIALGTFMSKKAQVDRATVEREVFKNCLF